MQEAVTGQKPKQEGRASLRLVPLPALFRTGTRRRVSAMYSARQNVTRLATIRHNYLSVEHVCRLSKC